MLFQGCLLSTAMLVSSSWAGVYFEHCALLGQGCILSAADSAIWESRGFSLHPGLVGRCDEVVTYLLVGSRHRGSTAVYAEQSLLTLFFNWGI